MEITSNLVVNTYFIYKEQWKEEQEEEVPLAHFHHLFMEVLKVHTADIQRQDKSLDHIIYGEKAHTNHYLSAKSSTTLTNTK